MRQFCPSFRFTFKGISQRPPSGGLAVCPLWGDTAREGVMTPCLILERKGSDPMLGIEKGDIGDILGIEVQI